MEQSNIWGLVSTTLLNNSLHHIFITKSCMAPELRSTAGTEIAGLIRTITAVVVAIAHPWLVYTAAVAAFKRAALALCYFCPCICQVFMIYLAKWTRNNVCRSTYLQSLHFIVRVTTIFRVLILNT